MSLLRVVSHSALRVAGIAVGKKSSLNNNVHNRNNFNSFLLNYSLINGNARHMSSSSSSSRNAATEGGKSETLNNVDSESESEKSIQNSNNSNNNNYQTTITFPTFEPVTLEDFSEIYAEDPSTKAKIQRILHQYEWLRYSEDRPRVPSKLTVANMRLLLQQPDDDDGLSLRSMLNYLYSNQVRQEKDERRREKKKASIIERLEMRRQQAGYVQSNGVFRQDSESGELTDELIYGLWHNTLFGRVQKAAVDRLRREPAQRLAALFGQKLVIDLDYDQRMDQREQHQLAKQLGLLYHENLIFDAVERPPCPPFDVHFVNCSHSGETIQMLGKHLKKMNELRERGYLHGGSYLDRPDLFPRENLVTVSQFVERPFPRRWNPDWILVIPGYINLTSNFRGTHIKAQQEGIPCYRLPIDEHVRWRQSHKNLCLNQIRSVLHRASVDQDWAEAFRRYAPARKMMTEEEMERDRLEREQRYQKRRTITDRFHGQERRFNSSDGRGNDFYNSFDNKNSKNQNQMYVSDRFNNNNNSNKPNRFSKESSYSSTPNNYNRGGGGGGMSYSSSKVVVVNNKIDKQNRNDYNNNNSNNNNFDKNFNKNFNKNNNK